MTSFENIEDPKNVLTTDPTLSTKKQSCATSCAYCAIGVAMLAGTYFVDHTNPLYFTFIVLGILLMAVGLVMLAKRSLIITTASGQSLSKKQYYFDVAMQYEIEAAIKEGNIDAIEAKAKTAGQLKAVVYSTKDNSYYVAQVLKYVPHSYEPTMNAVVYKK